MEQQKNINFNYPVTINLATAYVPQQIYQEHFSPQEGLRKGTIFPELYKPY